MYNSIRGNRPATRLVKMIITKLREVHTRCNQVDSSPLAKRIARGARWLSNRLMNGPSTE